MKMMMQHKKVYLLFLVILIGSLFVKVSPIALKLNHEISKRTYFDSSIRNFSTERICWSNEACKEAFHRTFRCRCPEWTYCRSIGRYYEAKCTYTQTGYVWMQ